jgi:molecular chaperone GrpE
MAEAENIKNEQPDVEPEETVTDTAAEEIPETEENTADAQETAAEESAQDSEETQEPAEQAPASVKEKLLLDKVAALEDKVKRQMAEFDNFRKRTSKEKEQMFSMGEKSVIEKMLPVVDNFERGLASVPEAEKSSAIVSGMEMVYKQLIKQLEDLGVKPIEAVGKEFDPNFHNAVMQVASEEYESGVVAQEYQKGYTYHDTVIRHSMVGVVQ